MKDAFSGYLRVENPRKKGTKTTYEVSIPNLEIRSVFDTTVIAWLNEKIHPDEQGLLLEALQDGRVKRFEHYLKAFVGRVVSYHDAERRYVENFYHAFLLGLLARVEYDYDIRSNREAGMGRYDICLAPKDKALRGIIIEIKAADPDEDESLQDAIDAAEKQLLDRKYETELYAQGIAQVLLLAVGVKGKTLKVQEVKAK